jgi:hypothetical protein
MNILKARNIFSTVLHVLSTGSQDYGELQSTLEGAARLVDIESDDDVESDLAIQIQAWWTRLGLLNMPSKEFEKNQKPVDNQTGSR